MSNEPAGGAGEGGHRLEQREHPRRARSPSPTTSSKGSGLPNSHDRPQARLTAPKTPEPRALEYPAG